MILLKFFNKNNLSKLDYCVQNKKQLIYYSLYISSWWCMGNLYETLIQTNFV